MHAYLRYATEAAASTLATIEDLAKLESPSRNAALVDRCADLFSSLAAPYGMVESFPNQSFGAHRLIRFHALQPRTQGKQLLMIGHVDTVWPEGTLHRMPVRRHQDRLYGPGVLDMKSGLAIALSAVKLLHSLNVAPQRPLAMLVTSDEEVGSPTSRDLIEQQAKMSVAALVLEPGSGLGGALKTARKGVGHYRIEVSGIASHAGVAFEAGASAITEVARQILTIAEWTDLERGTTINPGVIQGGTALNVVAHHAVLGIDVRVRSAADAASIDERLQALKPQDLRCCLTVTGKLNRPPMERTPAIADLYRKAVELAAPLCIDLAESSTGGGSDGNFTAAVGVPTLDGLGGVGEDAHAVHESILIDAIPTRVALLAALLAGL